MYFVQYYTYWFSTVSILRNRWHKVISRCMKVVVSLVY
ncbi:hypothetical protein JCM19232_187 [Vibrio ishigakensis]|uniref:Uncharacterized protein n=1 Tax=Vibrio ishigakensis TaxID=1481914 RepID=A0A0B8PAD0_9VIBR|nr:hypothetical protein JCM19232_187 [Vibrio ishigakensis]